MESHQHIRQVFDEELAALEHDVLEMGSLADIMVQLAVESLVDLDVEKAMKWSCVTTRSISTTFKSRRVV